MDKIGKHRKPKNKNEHNKKYNDKARFLNVGRLWKRIGKDKKPMNNIENNKKYGEQKKNYSCGEAWGRIGKLMKGIENNKPDFILIGFGRQLAKAQSKARF